MMRSFRGFGLMLLAACGTPVPGGQDSAAVANVQPVTLGGDSSSQRIADPPRTLASQVETLKAVPAVSQPARPAPPPPPPVPPAPPPNPPPPQPAPTPPPPPPVQQSRSYPNRPSNFTRVVSDYAMSTMLPAPGADRPMGDGSGWGIVGNPTRVSDSTDPVSPPWVLQWIYPAGRGTPTDSYNTGKIYHAIPNVNEIYIAFPVWHDDNFEFNAVSNKLMFFQGNNNGNSWSLTFESKHFSAYWALQAQGIPPGETTLYNPTVNRVPNPTGRWVMLEVLYKLGPGGYYKLFADGALVSNHTNLNLPTGAEQIMLDGTWGGGSGPSRRTSTRRIGHILIAHP